MLSPIAKLHLSVYLPHITHNSSIHSDEGLTLEMSALDSLYGSQFTLLTQLIKPKLSFSAFPPPLTPT